MLSAFKYLKKVLWEYLKKKLKLAYLWCPISCLANKSETPVEHWQNLYHTISLPASFPFAGGLLDAHYDIMTYLCFTQWIFNKIFFN